MEEKQPDVLHVVKKKRVQSKAPRKACPHGKRKSRCRQCNGVSFCEHDRDRYTCREGDCEGKSFCEHNHVRSTCKQCKGSSLCEEHGNVKSHCIPCGGSQVCIEHGVLKAHCRACEGVAFCWHTCPSTGKQKQRQKSQCKICSPNSNALCKGCGDKKVIKSKDYFCVDCHPTRKGHAKTREKALKAWLIEQDKYTFVYNHRIYADDGKYYHPDFLFKCGAHDVILECDEFAHPCNDVEDERSREDNIRAILGVPTVFIRYNPDGTGADDTILKKTLDEALREGGNDTRFLFY